MDSTPDPTAEPSEARDTTIEPRTSDDAGSVLPFDGLRAPDPVAPEPPTVAKAGALAAVVLSGLLGGLIGWATGDILFGSTVWAAIGLLLFGVGAAVGVGIVAGLTLRAMSEWSATAHPEDAPRDRFGRRMDS